MHGNKSRASVFSQCFWNRTLSRPIHHRVLSRKHHLSRGINGSTRGILCLLGILDYLSTLVYLVNEPDRKRYTEGELPVTWSSSETTRPFVLEKFAQE